jgi:hypothetical protein
VGKCAACWEIGEQCQGLWITGNMKEAAHLNLLDNLPTNLVSFTTSSSISAPTNTDSQKRNKPSKTLRSSISMCQSLKTCEAIKPCVVIKQLERTTPNLKAKYRNKSILDVLDDGYEMNVHLFWWCFKHMPGEALAYVLTKHRFPYVSARHHQKRQCKVMLRWRHVW